MHTWIKVWIPGDATDGPPPSSNAPPTVKDDFDDTSHPPSWRYSLPRINGCRLIVACHPTYNLRTGHQFENRKSTRTRHTTHSSRPRRRGDRMSSRREFIALLGGATAAWPLAARGEGPNRMRRIGVLMPLAANDTEGQSRLIGFVQAMAQSGWIDGHNVRIDTRWRGTDADGHRKHATELIALAPDTILAGGSISVSALQQATRTIPIVFVGVVDPVGSGFVDSLARTGNNHPGFTTL